MHDGFHTSLFHDHVPNDDCLFPGCMDTQLSIGDDSEGEWAVDKIPSHSWSGENALFEVTWKAGDKTWLPYHQVSCDPLKFHPLQDILVLQHHFNSCQHLTFVNRIILWGRSQFCWVECGNLCHFPVAFLAHNTHNTSSTPICDHPYLGCVWHIINGYILNNPRSHIPSPPPFSPQFHAYTRNQNLANATLVGFHWTSVNNV